MSKKKCCKDCCCKTKSQLEISVDHVIKTIVNQVVEVNKNIEATKVNANLSETDKNAMIAFANYHLLVLSILLRDLANKTTESFPEFVPVVEWAKANYKHGLENNQFIPCKCKDCNPVEMTSVL